MFDQIVYPVVKSAAAVSGVQCSSPARDTVKNLSMLSEVTTPISREWGVLFMLFEVFLLTQP